MPEPSTRVPRAPPRPRLSPSLPFALMLVAGGVAAQGLTADGASDRGEGLYANHCGDCHDATVHRREHRRVGSREELYGWVAAWSAHAGLGWGEEEIESVTSYLSRRVYRFTR